MLLFLFFVLRFYKNIHNIQNNYTNAPHPNILPHHMKSFGSVPIWKYKSDKLAYKTIISIKYILTSKSN